MDKRTERIRSSVTPELLAELEAIAQAMDCPVSYVIEAACKLFIRLHGVPEALAHGSASTGPAVAHQFIRPNVRSVLEQLDQPRFPAMARATHIRATKSA